MTKTNAQVIKSKLWGAVKDVADLFANIEGQDMEAATINQDSCKHYLIKDLLEVINMLEYIDDSKMLEEEYKKGGFNFN